MQSRNFVFLGSQINQSLLRLPRNEYRVSPCTTAMDKARENEGFEIEGTIKPVEMWWHCIRK